MPDPNNIVLKKYRTVAFCVPKNANTSIKQALMDATGKTGNPHGPGKFLTVSRWTAHFQYRKFFKFAFVRNPFARTSSCWKNKVRGERFHASFKRFGIKPDTSFEDFVRIISNWLDRMAEQHFRSQFAELYLTDVAKEPVLVPDFIGRVESMDSDWQQVKERCRENGLILHNLPKTNTTGAGAEYRQYYDRFTRSLIERKYKLDLEYFSYDF